MPNIDKDLIPLGAIVLLISFVTLVKRALIHEQGGLIRGG
jgi:hypothetical protein